MPRAEAEYIKHWAKYQRTESAISRFGDMKKARNDITMPESRVTHADHIMTSSRDIAERFGKTPIND